MTTSYRTERQNLRAWAKNKSPDVRHRAEIVAANFRELERRPHDTHLAELAAMNLLGLVGASDEF